MRLDRDNQERDWAEDDGQWTKEEAKRDPRFDFAAFLGPDSLDDQITDAMDGKDLLDEEAYGEFAPDYVPRRGEPGERGRHEAPGGPDPEGEEGAPEEDFGDGYETRRFTPEQLDEAEEEFQEETPQEPVYVDEPPPRPKVVVAPPTVYVDPQSEYGGGEEPPSGGGSAVKWLVAILISLVVIGGVVLLMTTVLPRLGEEKPDETAPSPTPTSFLDNLVRPEPTQPPAPTQAPEPTQEPEPTPPPVVRYTVTVTAGTGGTVSPSGVVEVDEGGSVSFAITPDEGYELGQLLIDGSPVSVQSSYTFSDVRQDHSIYAVFQATALPPTEAPAEPTEAPPAPTEAPAEEPVVTPEPPPVYGEGSAEAPPDA